MKISLITVTFNNYNTLKHTIKSVEGQGYPNLEYIVVDGGSSDGTKDLLISSVSTVTKWVSEPDNGIYHAMNKGLEMATGDVIGFLHSDDYFANQNVLNSVARVFCEVDVDMVYADLEYVMAQEPERIIRKWKSGYFSIDKVRRGWMPPHPTVYFSRELLSKTGFFDTSFRIAADYEWLLRCLTIQGLNIRYLPEVTIKMRAGGVSNRSFKNILKKSTEDLRAIHRHQLGGIFTLLLKNISKIEQFWFK